FILFLVLFNLAAATVTLFIGIVFKNGGVANLLGSLVMLFSLLFSGFLLNQESVPKFVGWLQRLSIFHYAFEGLIVNEVKYLSLVDHKYGLDIEVPGSAILSSFGFNVLALWEDCIGLGVFAGIFVVLAIDESHLSAQPHHEYGSYATPPAMTHNSSSATIEPSWTNPESSQASLPYTEPGSSRASSRTGRSATASRRSDEFPGYQSRENSRFGCKSSREADRQSGYAMDRSCARNIERGNDCVSHDDCRGYPGFSGSRRRNESYGYDLDKAYGRPFGGDYDDDHEYRSLSR
ncbi:hypothetical protein B0A49_08188, partial [Cryomyces minteri]